MLQDAKRTRNVDHLLGWLKPIYELVGTPWPRTSLFVAMILGALIFGGVWTLVAKQVDKDHHASSSTPANGPSTSGAQSPAISGNGNNVTYNETDAPEKKADRSPKGNKR